MKDSLHDVNQYRLLAGREGLDAVQRSELNAHLAGCTQCRAYAGHLQEIEPGLQRSLHNRWDPALPSQHFKRQILETYRRKKMYGKVSSISRSLAWLGILAVMVVVLAWAIPVLVFKQTPATIDLSRVFSRFLRQALTAADLNLQPDDLGPDWTLAMQESEFSPSTYWDVDEQGLPFLGEHSYSSAPFDLEDLEFFSARGFAHKDREAVLFSSVVIFKEESIAQGLMEKNFPGGLTDSDVPEELVDLQSVDIGDEGTRVYTMNDSTDGEIWGAIVGFRKGRVIYALIVQNHREGAIPLGEEELLELARRVEARIPADY